MASKRPAVAHEEVAAIRQALKALLNTEDEQGRRVRSAKFGVYCFYDYDGEPIYVGQTREGLGSRIGRHLTGQRSDAVAKGVLDPFEVAEVEAWPIWELHGRATGDQEAKRIVNAAEYAVYQRALEDSKFQAVLNEGAIPKRGDQFPVLTSVRGRIIPNDIYERRKHADIRIARRASTISYLARVISERELREPSGLRLTLETQAKRLQWLASDRLTEVRAAFPDKALTGSEDEEG